jgi:hypothetical protein
MQNENKTYEGLSGWVILVGIVIIVFPIRLGYVILSTFPPIFTKGTWEALTTPGLETYNVLWSPILIGELIVNTIIIAAALYLIYLFFSKNRKFPAWYIGIAVFSLCFIVIDAWAITFVLPNEPIFDSDTAKESTRSLIACLIWVPYMLVSKRVKATFVR